MATDASLAKVTLQAYVSGIVQGVGFRYFTMQQAEQWGLAGYAHNLADGRVEVVAQGPKARVERLLAWLECGPPTAQVDAVQWQWIEAAPFEGFTPN